MGNMLSCGSSARNKRLLRRYQAEIANLKNEIRSLERALLETSAAYAVQNEMIDNLIEISGDQVAGDQTIPVITGDIPSVQEIAEILAHIPQEEGGTPPGNGHTDEEARVESLYCVSHLDETESLFSLLKPGVGSRPGSVATCDVQTEGSENV